jgi:hypothetical protein
MRCSIFTEIDSARLRYYDELLSQNPGLLKPQKRNQTTKAPTIKFRIVEEPLIDLEEKAKPDLKELQSIPLVDKVIEEEPIITVSNNFINLTKLRQRLLDIFFSWFMSGDSLEADQIEHLNA